MRLIEKADVQEYVNVAETLPQRFVDRHIETSQRDFVRPILGDALYDELITQVANVTLTTANATLLGKIKPMLSFYTMMEYMALDGMYSTPMGYRQYSEENSEAITDKRRSGIIGTFRNKAESYTVELKAFLYENKGDYPTWIDCDTKENTSFGISQIAMPRRGRRNGITGAGHTYRKNP